MKILEEDREILQQKQVRFLKPLRKRRVSSGFGWVYNTWSDEKFSTQFLEPINKDFERQAKFCNLLDNIKINPISTKNQNHSYF